MRLPFPLALRVGTDIIATNRILSPLRPDIRRAVRLTNRFLLPQELDDLTRRFPAWKEHDRLRTQQVAAWIAGRWAAKEAAKKAWDASLLSFRDLRIEADSDGAVHIICDTRLTASHNSDHSVFSPTQVSEQVAQLSISHDGDYTVATVLATPLHPDIKAELQRRKTEAEAKLISVAD
ncbi:hypothetical protein H2200_008936 [Cladophialophora chaetospira]|uniref:4'-phosphopantetheinyl transferase domain-containing protein n=1 Tax=Cladophialophora chaetospira TaxID=386627 RepID=A0AA39CG59_9EURO|nr:hypothetical protein H2200_008936 [Cladophialophora chaetospira]